MVRRKKPKEIHEFITNLDEAKEVERHQALMHFFRWSGFVSILSFLLIVSVFLFLAVKNNSVPTLSEFSSLLGNITTVVGIAIGAPN